ncbi:hypothetical protein ABK040_001211 [Willaertia magna]
MADIPLPSNFYSHNLFGIGCNDQGQIGPKSKILCRELTPIDENRFQNNIKSVACCRDALLILTADQNLYFRGKLKASDHIEYKFKAIPWRNDPMFHQDAIQGLTNSTTGLSEEPEIVSIHCSTSDFYLLTKSRSLFRYNGKDFIKVDPFHLNVKIICTYLESADAFVITTDDEVYFSNAQAPFAFVNFKPSSKIVGMSCGLIHELVHCEDNLYVRGDNNCCQLGLDNEDVKVINDFTSFKTDYPFSCSNIKMVRCGNYHTILATKDSRIFTCGKGICGELGNGEVHVEKHVWLEVLTLKQRVVDIFAGCHTSYVIAEDKTIYRCGRNYEKALLINDVDNQTVFIPIKFTRKLKQIVTGSLACILEFQHFVTLLPKVNLLLQRDTSPFSDIEIKTSTDRYLDE